MCLVSKEWSNKGYVPLMGREQFKWTCRIEFAAAMHGERPKNGGSDWSPQPLSVWWWQTKSEWEGQSLLQQCMEKDVKMVAQVGHHQPLNKASTLQLFHYCGGRQKMCLESKGPYSQGDASTGHAESSYKKGQQCME